MFKWTLLSVLLLGSIISTSYASETRILGGAGIAECRGSQTESCSGQEFFRLGLEQVFTPQWSADIVADAKLFTTDERFNSFGVNLKYIFSPTASAVYVKAGPHYYQRRESTGIFRSESRSGVGISTALGWQNTPMDRVGYGVEVWYRTLDDFDAYGVSVFISAKLNIF